MQPIEISAGCPVAVLRTLRMVDYSLIQNKRGEAGKLAQWLRALVLAEDQGSISSTHILD